MPALVTKTIRITQDQELELLKYKGSSSYLFRSLYDIFASADNPGIEVLKLRKKIKEMLNGANGEAA